MFYNDPSILNYLPENVHAFSTPAKSISVTFRGKSDPKFSFAPI
jgi:hypothetical protein